jgi:uncharacterized protein (DUF2141 family)
MSKLWGVAVGAIGLMILPAVHVHAGTLGPHAAACEGDKPAMLVRVIGLKNRKGMLRVQLYGGAPERFLEKGTWIERIDAKLPSEGPVEVCLPVKPGTYAVSVRHDINGSGKSDMSDGGGLSGNPRVSLFDIAFKRKPSPAKISIAVGDDVRTVPIIMNYVQGGAFKPISMAAAR